MSITAIVENDTIKLPAGTHLPDGTQVEVLVSPEPPAPRAKLVTGEFGRRVLIAPPGAPPMTPERVKEMLEDLS